MMQVKKEMKKRVKQIGPGHPSHPDTQLSGRLGEHKGYKVSQNTIYCFFKITFKDKIMNKNVLVKRGQNVV